MSTIFAQASGAGRAGVAVVRISGPRVPDILKKIAGVLPPPRVATLASLKNPLSGITIDRALVLYFPAPHSFTGEDVAECHIHGSRAVMSALARALHHCGARLAEAGEFTRRAFDNDKLDLTEVEGLADLLAAETEAQRVQALRLLEGDLRRVVDGWHGRLKKILAHTEAAIDFTDDESIPTDLQEQQHLKLEKLHDEIKLFLADARKGERRRDGFHIAIVGAPNAGKSSLLNVLAQRDVAIVSPTPGTTRDVLEVYLDLGGYAVVLADTAGLRETTDAIEDEGIKRARARAQDADMVVLMVDAADSAGQTMPSHCRSHPDQLMVVMNKIDVCAAPTSWHGHRAFGLSLKTREGLDHFLQALTQRVAHQLQQGAAPSLTRERHREILGDVAAHLERGMQAPSAELQAEDIRLAMRSLGRMTGHVDTDDLLDIIFRDFCLGK
ncbi:MAG: tRNA uridine-5-carboxymethylaminomethyl(34) synthesis GTPase MnmE [Alphaproteobacteria bacterium]|nr:tRNA uridine-5-carboxymethylaminomethyl(34) synthesis GTPase MnmE [Alphaproteobacteria bacterium]